MQSEKVNFGNRLLGPHGGMGCTGTMGRFFAMKEKTWALTYLVILKKKKNKIKSCLTVD